MAVRITDRHRNRIRINDWRCPCVLMLRPDIVSIFHALGIIVFGFCRSYRHLRPSTVRHQSTANPGYVTIRELIGAVERYKADCEQYPSSAGGLDALVHSSGAACWKGPYLDGEVRVDPWRRAFLYRSDNGQPEVASFGADGKPAGEFFDMDISSRNMWMLLPESPTEIRTGESGSPFGCAWVGFLGCAYLLWMNRG